MTYQLAGKRRRRSRSKSRRYSSTRKRSVRRRSVKRRSGRRSSGRKRSGRKRSGRRSSKCNRKSKKRSCNRRSKGSRKCSWVKRKTRGRGKHRSYCKRGGGESNDLHNVYVTWSMGLAMLAEAVLKKRVTKIIRLNNFCRAKVRDEEQYFSLLLDPIEIKSENELKILIIQNNTKDSNEEEKNVVGLQVFTEGEAAARTREKTNEHHSFIYNRKKPFQEQKDAVTKKFTMKEKIDFGGGDQGKVFNDKKTGMKNPISGDGFSNSKVAFFTSGSYEDRVNSVKIALAMDSAIFNNNGRKIYALNPKYECFLSALPLIGLASRHSKLFMFLCGSTDLHTFSISNKGTTFKGDVYLGKPFLADPDPEQQVSATSQKEHQEILTSKNAGNVDVTVTGGAIANMGGPDCVKAFKQFDHPDRPGKPFDAPTDPSESIKACMSEKAVTIYNALNDTEKENYALLDAATYNALPETEKQTYVDNEPEGGYALEFMKALQDKKPNATMFKPPDQDLFEKDYKVTLTKMPDELKNFSTSGLFPKTNYLVYGDSKNFNMDKYPTLTEEILEKIGSSPVNVHVAE